MKLAPMPSLWKLLWLLEAQKEAVLKIRVVVKVATGIFDPKNETTTMAYDSNDLNLQAN